MSGIREGMVIQERDKHLLCELSVMRIVDREQAKVVAGFSSTTRVNARLLLLTNAGIIKRFFVGTRAGGTKALYSLSDKGGHLVGFPATGPRRPADQVLVADFFVEHQLAINAVYVAAKYGRHPEGVSYRDWRNFAKCPAKGTVLIPDGYLEFETPTGVLAAFVEVDLGNERLKVWQGKVRNYVDLAVSGKFTKDFHQDRFRVLAITPSQGRLHSLRQSTALLTEKIFWFTTLADIQREGLFGAIWIRPTTNQCVPLLKEAL